MINSAHILIRMYTLSYLIYLSSLSQCIIYVLTIKLKLNLFLWEQKKIKYTTWDLSVHYNKMASPFQMSFTSFCSFLWELFLCVCFSFMHSDLTYTRLMSVDSRLPHHNIVVECCLFHLRWRDCSVSYNIACKQTFERGCSCVWICPSAQRSGV